MNKMKKYILSIFIVGLSLFGFAQDRVLIDEDFNSFTPTGWTVDGSATPDAKTWTQSGYPIISSDTVQLNEYLTSPNIELDQNYTYQIGFKYAQYGNNVVAGDLEVLVSYDGTTWDPTDANAALVWPKADATADTWITIAGQSVTPPATTGDVKFAFRFFADGSEMDLTVDNFVIQVDSAGDNTPTFPTGWEDLTEYKFETGFNGWTIVSQSGSNATQTWQHESLCKVGEDTDEAQTVLLKTPKIAVPDVEYTDFDVTVDFYSYLSRWGDGVRLYVTTQDDWVTLNNPIDLSYNINNDADLHQLLATLIKGTHYNPGDSMQFVFEFANTPAGSVDFYLQHFTFELVFDETAISGDAEYLDLTTTVQPDSVISPLYDKYNIITAEGFWQVQPDNWAIDTAGFDGAILKNAASDLNHDYFAVFTPDADIDVMDVSMTTDAIAYDVPNVGAAYMVNFEWATESEKNAGNETDPNITGALYNYGDFVVEISTNVGSSWTEVWWEDNEETLNETTSNADRNYNGNLITNAWVDYDAYMANGLIWYASSVDISSYLTGTGNLLIRFNYSTINTGAGKFYLDNFYVMQTVNPEFEMDGTMPLSVDKTDGDYFIDYYNIPISQLDNPVNFGSIIYNYGLTSFPDGQFNVTVNGNAFGYTAVTDDSWTSGNKFWEVTHFGADYTGGLTVETGTTYNVGYSLNVNGINYNDSKKFYVTNNVYTKVDTTVAADYTTPLSINDGTSGSVGSVFEFANSDVVTKVTAALSSGAETEAYLTIIKLDEPNDATGTKVFTSKRVVIENTGDADYEFEVGVKLEGGNYYAFMINLTDNTNVLIATEDTFEGQIVRGNADALYNDNLEENIYIKVGIVPNAAPEITTEFPNNRVVVAAVDPATQDSVTITIVATDENGDDLSWPADARILSPEWLAGWMNFNDSKGDTLILSGKPDNDDLGTTNVTVVVEDEKGAQTSYDFDIEVVSELAYFEPDYNADFRQFTQIDDELGEGTTENWTRTKTLASINGEVGKEQEEWLVSTPIKIPAASKAVGESYRLEFKWKAGTHTADSKYFIGGIAGSLGTEDTDGGANYADVKLVVSTDNGDTWSAPIWKEDDASLLAPVTDGIYEGAKWGYKGNFWYNSVLNLDAYAGKVIYFAFVYESKNVETSANNKFEIKEFSVLGNNEVDVDIFVHTDFTSIPTQHFNWTTGLTYDVQLINYGQSIPEDASYALSFPLQGYYEEFAINDATFATSDTVWKQFTFVPDSGIMTGYTLTATLDVDDNVGNNSDNKTIDVANNAMNRDKGNSVTEETLEQYDGLGTVYPLAVNDMLEKITVNFATAGSHFSVSVIKLETADAVTGKIIATTTKNYAGAPTDLVTAANLEIVFEEPIELEAGYYAVMVNQIVENEIVEVLRSDRDQDKLGFVRGSEKSLYNEVDDKGYLDMVINFTANEAPEFVAISVENEDVYQGQQFNRTVLTKNLNTYGTIFIEEVVMPQWLSFNDNGDGTATIAGDVSEAEPGDYTIEIRAHNRFMIVTKSFVVSVYPNPAPVFSTTPPTVAFEGAPFSYTASGYDLLGDNITITAEMLPTWITATASGTDLVLTGTPDATNIGNNVIKLAITDVPYGNVTFQTFNLYVNANNAPEFASTPGEDAFINMEYIYYVVANDANGNDGLAITATGVPAWLIFTDLNNGKATLIGTPTAAGADDIVLTVTDPSGATATQSFTVTVNSNTAPVFTSTAVTVAKEDTNYVYYITATDADDDYLYFSTEVIPNWMTFTVTGNGQATLQGIPLQSNVGDNVVSILVGDGNNTVLQDFTVVVAEVNDAPMFKSTAVETASVNNEYSYVVEGWDEEGAELLYDGQLPSWLTITQTGDGMALVSGTPTEDVVGDVAISLTVSDGNSTVEQVYNLSVSGALGINNSSNNAIELYPNPTSGVFNLKYAEGTDVYVFNATGKIVKQIENASNFEVIDISEFNAGSYFIKIVSTNGVLTKPLNLIK